MNNALEAHETPLTDSVDRDKRSRWWREWEVFALLAFFACIYCGRATVLPIFGEEPRRGLIAREMLETGDWITPRVQGIPRLSRPPLQNWLIAGCSYFTGSVETWAVRLPSLLATLLTVVLVYAVARVEVSRQAAFVAALSFGSMYNVLEYGRLGETEALFTFFVGSSLLVWWAGRKQGWPAWAFWTTGYVFLALGLLTKGLQAPVYFVGSTWGYLLLTGRGRELLTRGHLVGLVIGGCFACSWQMAFLLQQGVEKSLEIYFWNVAGRFEETRWLKIVGHWLSYPPEVLLGAIFPWSALLAVWAFPAFRRSLGRFREPAIFFGLAAILCFVIVWLPPGSRSRYYLPLHPVLAMLIGIVWQRFLEERNHLPEWVARGWQPIHRACAVLVAGLAIACGVAVTRGLETSVALGTITLLVPAVGLFWLTTADRRKAWFGPMAAALAMCAIYDGPILELTAQRCAPVGEDVARLKAELGSETPVASFGQLMHTFLFYYGEPIPIADVPSTGDRAPTGVFLIHAKGSEPIDLPFEWEPLGEVACDRFRKDVPFDRIIAGRAIQTLARGGVETSSTRR